MSETRTYVVVMETWIDGRHYRAGDTVPMTAAQAKYWVLAGTLKPAAE